MKCLNNNCPNESDNKLRVYQIDGKKYSGTRNFCSDECEDTYCNNKAVKYPEEANRIVRVV